MILHKIKHLHKINQAKNYSYNFAIYKCLKCHKSWSVYQEELTGYFEDIQKCTSVRIDRNEWFIHSWNKKYSSCNISDNDWKLRELLR